MESSISVSHHLLLVPSVKQGSSRTTTAVFQLLQVSRHTYWLTASEQTMELTFCWSQGKWHGQVSSCPQVQSFSSQKAPGWCRKWFTHGKSRMTLHKCWPFPVFKMDFFTFQETKMRLIMIPQLFFCPFCEDGYKIVLSPVVKALPWS